jgi:hypothetical protein
VLSQEDQGRYAWSQLHSQPELTPEWYEDWLKLIPKHGCRCYDHWRQITDKRPPDFSSLEAFRLWAIAAHNDVNKLTGKQQWAGSTLDAANVSFAISPGVIE